MEHTIIQSRSQFSSDNHPDRQLNETVPKSQIQRICQSQNLLVQKITQFNHKALLGIQNQEYEQALLNLGEAEKILEYAASCGRSIEIGLIMATLKNSACAHQRLWELSAACDYVEGLLVNINLALSEKSRPLTVTSQNNSVSQNNSIQSSITQNLNLQNKVAIHSLQYSALLSQNKKHEDSKKTVLKAFQHFHKVFEMLVEQQKKLKNKNSSILLSLAKYTRFQKNTLKPHIRDNMFRETVAVLKNLEDRRQFVLYDEENLRKFSISDIMNIGVTEVSKEIMANQKTVQQYLEQESLVRFALYISCCYFALSTQLRLINNACTLQQHRKHTTEYKQSKNYHLLSIYIGSSLVLCRTNYLNHIIKSFHSNYNIDLSQIVLNNSYELTVENCQPKIMDFSSIQLQSFRNVRSIQFVDESIGDDLGSADQQIWTIPKNKGLVIPLIQSKYTKLSTADNNSKTSYKTNTVSEFILVPTHKKHMKPNHAKSQSQPKSKSKSKGSRNKSHKNQNYCIFQQTHKANPPANPQKSNKVPHKHTKIQQQYLMGKRIADRQNSCKIQKIQERYEKYNRDGSRNKCNQLKASKNKSIRSNKSIKNKKCVYKNGQQRKITVLGSPKNYASVKKHL